MYSIGDNFMNSSVIDSWRIIIARETVQLINKKNKACFVKCISLKRYHDKVKSLMMSTVYPKKYAHGFCFAVLCCGYTLTDFPISIRLTSLALWQSSDCLSASKATLMNMDKYFMWIHYERLRNHNKAKYNKTVCIFLGIYCSYLMGVIFPWLVISILMQLTQFMPFKAHYQVDLAIAGKVKTFIL